MISLRSLLLSIAVNTTQRRLANQQFSLSLYTFFLPPRTIWPKPKPKTAAAQSPPPLTVKVGSCHVWMTPLSLSAGAAVRNGRERRPESGRRLFRTPTGARCTWNWQPFFCLVPSRTCSHLLWCVSPLIWNAVNIVCSIFAFTIEVWGECNLKLTT